MKTSGALLMFAVIGIGLNARADCAEGPGYNLSLNAAPSNVFDPSPTVGICYRGTADGGSPGNVMLRQDVATGAVVRLADVRDALKCFVDECVPPGTYRYGFDVAYDCSMRGCSGPQYYNAITVPAVDGGGPCARLRTADAGPVEFLGQVPWPEPPPDAGERPAFVTCPGHGCSMVPDNGGVSGPLAAFNGAVVVVALGLMFRRRLQRR